jgi:hypothetical protein
MALCLCAPTTHKGSFRYRLHCARKERNGNSLCTKVLSYASLATGTFCLCSPTSHPGSFCCHLHRSSKETWSHAPQVDSKIQSNLTKPNKCINNDTTARIHMDDMDLTKKLQVLKVLTTKCKLE